MAAEESSLLRITSETVDDTRRLTLTGVLNGITYLLVRDAIIKAAIDEPKAVLVDIARLDVPSESALAVFTSARWYVDRWPEVPILLVCAHIAGRNALSRNGITRYIPMYSSMADAMSATTVAAAATRRRMRAELPAVQGSVRRSQDLLAQWLTDWSLPEYVSAARVAVTVLVENVLEHTQSSPVIRLERHGATLTIVVEDCSGAPAGMREKPDGHTDLVSGLAILDAVSRVWGNTPTPTGKAVWAVLLPEDRR